MFGTTVVSNWQEGSEIHWNSERQGKTYEDKGKILKLDPERLLQYSHFSLLFGNLDILANDHIVTIQLSANGDQTNVSLANSIGGLDDFV
jgi:hypothetical protein